MDYQAFTLTPLGGENREIVMAELLSMGFNSFHEDENGLQAFIPEDELQHEEIDVYIQEKSQAMGFTVSKERVSEQNWNAIWEKEYEPVLIANKCMIRAPFHPPILGIDYDLVIEPRMSFGTAHHETTALMIYALLDENVQGKRVLDHGCGTGVLAILASKMGAAQVDAIDHDPWAFDNARDNVVKNNCPGVNVILGDAMAIPSIGFELVLANINRNILLHDMRKLASCLLPGGILLLSGFYQQDLLSIRDSASGNALSFQGYSSKNQWVCAKFIKQ